MSSDCRHLGRADREGNDWTQASQAREPAVDLGSARVVIPVVPAAALVIATAVVIAAAAAFNTRRLDQIRPPAATPSPRLYYRSQAAHTCRRRTSSSDRWTPSSCRSSNETTGQTPLSPPMVPSSSVTGFTGGCAGGGAFSISTFVALIEPSACLTPFTSAFPPFASC